MLVLKDIIKDYPVGDRQFRALNKVNMELHKGEFVAILGPSGCGKTTTLNIVGGLDRYTSGDLIINGTSTRDFKEKDWDAYRNNSIGFVFQSYNLINHLSVLDNVELGMTLSGVAPKERKERAIKVLKRVGLENQIHKSPTKLSGGEKQRVAIARALLNDPDIILADEPTGALDSSTAHEILNLIKEVGKDKLIIMVTHARMYADEYASRTIELKDGEIVHDTGSTVEADKNEGYEPNKTAMNFWTALKLSFNNLRTKKFRTTITALASSIGIIGVGLVLSISNGFSRQLDEVEQDQLVGLPILIGREEMQIGFDRAGATSYIPEGAEENEIVVYDPDMAVHTNLFTENFLNHLALLNEDVYTNMHFEYGYTPTLITERDGVPEIVELQDLGFSTFIVPEEELGEYYTVKAGTLPQNQYEVVLQMDEWNVVEKEVIEALGYDSTETLYYEDVLGKELYVALNDDLYIEQGGIFLPNYGELETVADNGVTVTIVGLVEATGDTVQYSNGGIKYLYELKTTLLQANAGSTICTTQLNSDTSIFDLTNVTEEQKEMLLSFLGCNTSNPFLIQIYTDSVEHKEAIKNHIAVYNEGKDVDDKIFETDLAEAIGETLGTLITSVSVVLTAFASISLVVSSVMIGVIIYISVLERTKEIGIIRSLGGRKKDISRVFNAESVIIGAFAGLLGIAITFVLTFPINSIAVNYDESLANVAQVNVLHLILLVIASTILTFIGGFIPSRIAAKKDPVEALRVD
ncbi:ATP-binding cassette domain-containing protein [Candidatus Xianfuyuplasma coldseepsis]|uniref:ATP-binding cassette domain-containing protein n=1 Tax=Candidatus Xianfuyuplasma coldseepsis TaxID=2782163 RepID=A0A7L7KPM1_9MOLU|nr:ABC transporter ATP-binding protein/permease [Xianfuyuplasma coldseepsis]QMS84653.1 ATP-binding cassette domain-containing protein [Xianfuyuplasma coldseepsis]